jgi:hypothetical protein
MMTKNQRTKLKGIFDDIIKFNIIWRNSTDVAAIFGGHRTRNQILVAIHNSWIEYMSDQDLERWAWEIPILHFRRVPPRLGLAIPFGNEWLPCGSPPSRGGWIETYTEDRLRQKM